mgnify:CR=1 FL=1
MEQPCISHDLLEFLDYGCILSLLFCGWVSSDGPVQIGCGWGRKDVVLEGFQLLYCYALGLLPLRQ